MPIGVPRLGLKVILESLGKTKRQVIVGYVVTSCSVWRFGVVVELDVRECREHVLKSLAVTCYREVFPKQIACAVKPKYSHEAFTCSVGDGVIDIRNEIGQKLLTVFE